MTEHDDTYNGWKNRETWAFNLHWQNDQGLYLDVLQFASDFLAQRAEEEDDHNSDYQIGEAVVEYLDERTSLPYWRDEVGVDMPELFWLMREDVGSFYRIDRAETGACVRESLDNES